MGNRYERSRLSRSFTYKGIQYHPGMLIVLAAQVVCLSAFSFAANLLTHDKWLSVMLGFSLLFGLILSLGFFGTWSGRSSTPTRSNPPWRSPRPAKSSPS
jgi:hypothetical protein